MSLKQNDTYQEKILDMIDGDKIFGIKIDTSGRYKIINPLNTIGFKIEEILSILDTQSMTKSNINNNFIIFTQNRLEKPRALNRLASKVVMILKGEDIINKENTILGDCIIINSNYLR